MFAQSSSNAILTKSRAMYGKRLKSEDYKYLLGRHSVNEVALYLKTETAYEKTLAGIQESLIHRGQLENLIRRDTLRKYIRLSRYESSPDKGFYRYYIINIETEQILTCLKLMNSGLAEGYIETLPGYLQEFISIDVIKLAQARSFDDILQVLAKTDYYDVLAPFRPGPGAHPDLFACEFALRQFFYDKTFELIDRHYHGQQKKQLTEIFTMQIELGNISSIYRLKRYFHSTPGEISSRILKAHDKRFDRRMQALIATKTPEDMLALLNQSHRHNVYSAEGGFSFIEQANQRRRFDVNRRFVSYSIYPPVVFASFLILSQIEIDNLASIIEGIRYKVPESELAKHVVA